MSDEYLKKFYEAAQRLGQGTTAEHLPDQPSLTQEEALDVIKRGGKVGYHEVLGLYEEKSIPLKTEATPAPTRTTRVGLIHDSTQGTYRRQGPKLTSRMKRKIRRFLEAAQQVKKK